MIKYDPAALLKKIAPERKIKKLLSKKLSLKRAALSFLDEVDFISKKSVKDVALKVIKNYKERRARAVVESGFERGAGAEFAAEIVDDPKLLINRIQNEIVFQISNEIGDKYQGERYTWLPSSADEPDPEHQLNYGQEFIIGEGEMPGERYGCQCGMEIHVSENQLNLGD